MLRERFRKTSILFKRRHQRKRAVNQMGARRDRKLEDWAGMTAAIATVRDCERYHVQFSLIHSYKLVSRNLPWRRHRTNSKDRDSDASPAPILPFPSRSRAAAFGHPQRFVASMNLVTVTLPSFVMPRSFFRRPHHFKRAGPVLQHVHHRTCYKKFMHTMPLIAMVKLTIR